MATKTTYVALAEDGTLVKKFNRKQPALDEYGINKDVAAIVSLPSLTVLLGDEIEVDESVLEGISVKKRRPPVEDLLAREWDEVDIPETKTCGRCKVDLPNEVFGRGLRFVDGLRPWCKPCTNAYSKERRDIREAAKAEAEADVA